MMKKIIFLIIASALLLSCSKDDDTACWEFTYHTLIQIGDSIRDDYTTYEICDMTEEQAEAERKSKEKNYIDGDRNVLITCVKRKL